MFICESCHTKEDLCPDRFGSHLSTSYGPCESCNETGNCVECFVHKRTDYQTLLQQREERQRLLGKTPKQPNVKPPPDPDPKAVLEPFFSYNACGGRNVLPCPGCTGCTRAKPDPAPLDPDQRRRLSSLPKLLAHIHDAHHTETVEEWCKAHASELYEQVLTMVCYLWTRDAGVPVERIEEYVVLRLLAPMQMEGATYTDQARLKAVRDVLKTMGWQFA